MKSILILLLCSGVVGCHDNHVKDWTIIKKSPVLNGWDQPIYNGMCIFVINDGYMDFTDSCNKYQVGQKIK